MLAPEQHLMCQLLLCFGMFVCLFLAVLMDFTSLLLPSENIKKTIQVVWMPRWFCGEIWLQSIHFWNWWSLYIFTWLHLYKICGLLSALDGHEGSTLGLVRVPGHYTLHHFTAGTLLNCCHHPKQSFYVSILSSFPQERLISNMQTFFVVRWKKEESLRFLFTLAFQIIFFGLLSPSQWAVSDILASFIPGQWK